VRLVSSLGVSAGFIDFVRGFGFKSSSTDENFGGYHRRIRNQLNQQNIGYGSLKRPSCAFPYTLTLTLADLCFNVRYPERVSRDGEYPWVLRHTAVYQSCQMRTSSSTWILLQPSQNVQNKLKSILNDPNPDENATSFDRECMIIFMILSATETNWRWYINYLESEINELVSGISLLGSVVDFADTLALIPG
jgi:hypothetical protein